jgi:hypothetical protein
VRNFVAANCYPSCFALEAQDLILDIDGEIVTNLGYGRWEEVKKEQGKMCDLFSEE